MRLLQVSFFVWRHNDVVTSSVYLQVITCVLKEGICVAFLILTKYEDNLLLEGYILLCFEVMLMLYYGLLVYVLYLNNVLKVVLILILWGFLEKIIKIMFDINVCFSMVLLNVTILSEFNVLIPYDVLSLKA